MKQRGKFIVLEGVDGSGITTQTERLKHWLEAHTGDKVLMTKEPSEGPVGFLIRQALTKRVVGLSQETLALLFAADRLDHIKHKILPALEEGNHVVCDRYLMSSLAYQGLELDIEWIKEVNACAIPVDLTIFIKVDPSTTMNRIKTKRFQVDLFEQEATLRTVLSNYELIISQGKQSGYNIVQIDGEQSLDQVTYTIQTEVKKYLGIEY
ncbi:MAG: dTMP kinase [Desulfitobacterium hafniense]|nr:dTMP kinase [Desulfitobacterium hafniense]